MQEDGHPFHGDPLKSILWYAITVCFLNNIHQLNEVLSIRFSSAADNYVYLTSVNLNVYVGMGSSIKRLLLCRKCNEQPP